MEKLSNLFFTLLMNLRFDFLEGELFLGFIAVFTRPRTSNKVGFSFAEKKIVSWQIASKTQKKHIFVGRSSTHTFL